MEASLFQETRQIPPPSPPFTTKTYLSTREIVAVTVKGAIVYSRWRLISRYRGWAWPSAYPPFIDDNHALYYRWCFLFVLCPRVSLVGAYFFMWGWTCRVRSVSASLTDAKMFSYAR